MRSILITGCNRGLGLGFIKHLTNKSNTKKPEIIIATCRNLGKATELKQIADQNKNLHILEIDVQNFNKHDQFAKQVTEITQPTGGLNVLINNAGVTSKFTRIQLVKPEVMLENFTVNTLAPIMITKSLLHVLKQFAATNQSKKMGIERGLVVNITSILGSISLNADGGFYPYRCSKVALNMATRSMSADLKDDGIMAVCLHPGWVQTDMGGKKAPVPVAESVSKLIQLMHTFNETHNGNFYQWDGKPLQW